MGWSCRALLVGAVVGAASGSAADTYQVGPGRTYPEIAAVADRLGPGDVVEVDGGATYGPVSFERDGSAAAPIVIRGVRVDGRRPVVSGGANTVAMRGDHYVLEGFEITGGDDPDNYVCVRHEANDIVVRDVLVHDCLNHGILGTDTESGSLTVEYSELFNNGNGEQRHQLYIATDEGAFPGSVFRLQHTYIHDGKGGNNVKSRSERNEIYGNWIEGAVYHELDLIGSEESPEGVAREDSDVVGNVIINTSGYQIARIGGDGTGETNGRYRFVNNTFVLAGGDLAIRAQDGIESLEMSNNAVVRPGGGPVRVLRDTDASWASGAPAVFGVRNWFPPGSMVAAGIIDSVGGDDPGFIDLATLDVRLADGSLLVDSGAPAPPPFADFPLPAAAALPYFLPPSRSALAPGTATPRPAVGTLDVGAFELGSGDPLQPPDAGGGNGGGDGGDGAGDDPGGCCSIVSRPSPPPSLIALAVITLALLRLRRRQTRRASTGRSDCGSSARRSPPPRARPRCADRAA